MNILNEYMRLLNKAHYYHDQDLYCVTLVTDFHSLAYWACKDIEAFESKYYKQIVEVLK